MMNIAKQIEAFHKLKAEIEGDLEDFMDEIESKEGENGHKLINLPSNFDEIVEV